MGSTGWVGGAAVDVGGDASGSDVAPGVVGPGAVLVVGADRLVVVGAAAGRVVVVDGPIVAGLVVAGVVGAGKVVPGGVDVGIDVVVGRGGRVVAVVVDVGATTVGGGSIAGTVDGGAVAGGATVVEVDDVDVLVVVVDVIEVVVVDDDDVEVVVDVLVMGVVAGVVSSTTGRAGSERGPIGPDRCGSDDVGPGGRAVGSVVDVDVVVVDVVASSRVTGGMRSGTRRLVPSVGTLANRPTATTPASASTTPLQMATTVER